MSVQCEMGCAPSKKSRGKVFVISLAASVGAALVLVLIAFTSQETRVRVSFLEYERSGSSNYAVLILTNSSRQTFYFTSHNTSPEGTVRHFVRFREGDGWTEAVENRPAIPTSGTLYRFSMEIAPGTSSNVRVPVDEKPRKVAVPMHAPNTSSGEFKQLLQILQHALRQLLGIKSSPQILVWCPTELQVPPSTDSRE